MFLNFRVYLRGPPPREMPPPDLPLPGGACLPLGAELPVRQLDRLSWPRLLDCRVWLPGPMPPNAVGLCCLWTSRRPGLVITRGGCAGPAVCLGGSAFLMPGLVTTRGGCPSGRSDCREITLPAPLRSNPLKSRRASAPGGGPPPTWWATHGER